MKFAQLNVTGRARGRGEWRIDGMTGNWHNWRGQLREWSRLDYRRARPEAAPSPQRGCATSAAAAARCVVRGWLIKTAGWMISNQAGRHSRGGARGERQGVGRRRPTFHNERRRLELKGQGVRHVRTSIILIKSLCRATALRRPATLGADKRRRPKSDHPVETNHQLRQGEEEGESMPSRTNRLAL